MNTPLLSFLNNLLKKSNGGLKISVHFWTDMNPAPNRFIQQFFKYRLQHILFWTLYVVFQTIIYQRYDGTGKALFNALIVNAFHATAVYFNIYFLIPRLLYHKRYVLYFIMLFCTLFLTAFALLQLILWMEPDTQNLLLETFSGLIVGIAFTVTGTMVVKIMIYWFRQQQLTIQLEKQQVETELKFLKSQIQPHFLFNVLNNIYSLALQKSEQTPDVVLRLSEFLRHILYEAGDKKIPLEREVEYLNNYIELQRIRFGNRAEVSFETSGQMENLHIEPMLLITFLENSFKHGVGSQMQQVWVKINMDVKDNELTFEVRNSKPAEDKKGPKGPGGIGLENVKRRLELLYPNAHQLTVNELTDEYHINLKLSL